MAGLQETVKKKIRVLIAKPGLDGHDRGAKVISLALRDAGMEVIYTGRRQTAEQIVQTAIQEDVDVIGLSLLAGDHMVWVPKIINLLKQNKMDNVMVLVGGIIPKKDILELKKMGVAEVFGPGTLTKDIVSFIRENLGEKGKEV